MGICLYLAVLLAGAPGPHATEPPHLSPRDLDSDYAIQGISYAEVLEPFAEETIYVRSVVGSETREIPGMDEPVRLSLMLHGLYRRDGDRWLPLWEEIGSDYEDYDYQGCADGYAGPLNGGFVACHFTTRYMDLPGRPAPAFCIQKPEQETFVRRSWDVVGHGGESP